MYGYVKPCDQQPRLSMSNPMRSKISVHIERALLGKSSDVGISALGIDSGRMTGNPEVISSHFGLVPTNALVVVYFRGGVKDNLAGATGLETASPAWQAGGVPTR